MGIDLHPGGIFFSGFQSEPIKGAQGDLGFPAGGAKKKNVIGLKGEKEGGAGFVLAEGDEGGAVGTCGGGDHKKFGR